MGVLIVGSIPPSRGFLLKRTTHFSELYTPSENEKCKQGPLEGERSSSHVFQLRDIPSESSDYGLPHVPSIDDISYNLLCRKRV